MKISLKEKGTGWYLCTAAAIIALVTAVVVLLTYKTVLPNSLNGTDLAIVLLIGVVIQVIVTVLPVKFAPLLSVVCYSVALGLVINKIPSAIVDFINGIFYTGGNFAGCMVYAGCTLATVVLAIVACFLRQTSSD